MPIRKPRAVANDPFKSAKWDEITAGRTFTTSHIPTLTLLVQWYAVVNRCISDMDDAGGQGRIRERHGRLEADAADLDHEAGERRDTPAEQAAWYSRYRRADSNGGGNEEGERPEARPGRARQQGAQGDIGEERNRMDARQEPTYSANIPSCLDGNGEDAAALAAAFFGDPMPWQRHVLRVMLARDERDKSSTSVFALSVPRQNGKRWDVRARCFYGLVCSGEKILFTCQHGDTADEMFKDLSAVFEDEDNAELHELLKAVRKSNGQQAIYLENGGYIRFTTRTNSLARGKTYDVLIYDEAQELAVAQQAASLPTISAGTLGNPQTIYLGTPPDPECAGTVFRALHDRVHAGTSTAAWMEWAADEVGDPGDRERWYECNPSLGLRLNPGAVEDEASSMPPDSFARERLGWWVRRPPPQTLPSTRRHGRAHPRPSPRRTA